MRELLSRGVGDFGRSEQLQAEQNQQDTDDCFDVVHGWNDRMPKAGCVQDGHELSKSELVPTRPL